MSRLGGDESEGRVTSSGLPFSPGNGSLDLRVTVEVERTACVLHIPDEELSAHVIVCSWSIREREGLRWPWVLLGEQLWLALQLWHHGRGESWFVGTELS